MADDERFKSATSTGIKVADALTPTPLDDKMKVIAEKLKTEAEKKTKQSYSSFSPRLYIKSSSNYCVRYEHSGHLLDIAGKVALGKVSGLKVKDNVRESDLMSL